MVAFHLKVKVIELKFRGKVKLAILLKNCLPYKSCSLISIENKLNMTFIDTFSIALSIFIICRVFRLSVCPSATNVFLYNLGTNDRIGTKIVVRIHINDGCISLKG